MNIPHDRLIVITAMIQAGMTDSDIIITLKNLLKLDLRTATSLRPEIVYARNNCRLVDGSILYRIESAGTISVFRSVIE
jgi:hypothetical protein